MRLEDIAATLDRADVARVPEWTLGTVHRRSITFATGLEDAATFVVWVQAHAMTGDLRIHPARPEMVPGDRFEDMDLASLVLLASVEGGCAATSVRADGLMSWTNWIGFQPYDKYPEPGLLRRVGDCMIEHAPSGIYVEDWRFQASRRGLLAGLRLVAEVGRDGVHRPRTGGMVIAGDHAIHVLARRDELAEGTRAQDFVRDAADPVAALNRVMDCRIDYAVLSDDGYRVRTSTDPRRTGAGLELMTSFSIAPDGHLVQTIDDPEVAARLWSIDSLAADVSFPLDTTADANAIDWLAREADTLIHPAQQLMKGTGA